MVEVHAPDSIAIPESQLGDVRALYEQGLYLQAYHKATQIAPLRKWRGTPARILAGRLAGNLGGGRLAWTHFLLAYRETPSFPDAIYFVGQTFSNRRGPLETLEWIERHGDLSDAPLDTRTAWLALKARTLGYFRDFERAHAVLDSAQRLRHDDPWVDVERSGLLGHEDRYEESLESSRRAMAKQAFFRPAVQQAAVALMLLGRDDEAISLLTEATTRLESSVVELQLAQLRITHGRYEAARESLERATELSPLADRDFGQYLTALRSDVAYHLGDRETAIKLARELGDNKFYAKVADNLAEAAGDGHRKVLDVGFVRQHHMTCAPATLSAIAGYWSVPVDHLELAEEICYDGTSHDSERHWAEQSGWATREFTVDFATAKKLIDQELPFSLSTITPGNAHLHAVVGYDSARRTLLIRDPTVPDHIETLADELAQHARSTGPRGMLMVPRDHADRLDALDLPDADIFDDYHKLQRAIHDHDRSAAIEIAGRMASRAPDHRLTHYARMVIGGYDSNPQVVLEAAEALLAIYPDDPVVLLVKLRVLNELGQQAERLEIYERVCASRDCAPIFWQQYAQELAESADTGDEAERLLRRAIRRGSDLGPSLSILGGVLWDRLSFDEATRLYRLAACVSAHDESCTRTYFAACHRLGSVDEALDLMEDRFRRLATKSAQPAQSLYWAYDQLDRSERAAEVLDEAQRCRPDDGGLLVFVADAFGRIGNVDKAAEALEKARGKLGRASWLLSAATLARYRGRRGEAIRMLQEILSIEPLHIDAHQAIAQLLAEEVGRQAAIDHLNAAAVKYPHSQSLHTILVEWIKRDDPAEAVEVLARMIAANPTDAWARRERAIILSQLGRFDEARAEFEEAHRLAPTNPAYWCGLGDLEARMGRTQQAVSAFRKAIEVSVDTNYAITQFLTLCADHRERRDALTSIWRELFRQNTDGDGLFEYARLAADALTPRELLDQLRKIHKKRPKLWATWSVLAWQLLQTDQADEALRVATEASERFLQIPRLLYDLARVHEARGEQDAAIDALKRSLEINADYALAIRELAASYDRRHQLADARAVLERAAGRTPLEPWVHLDLGDLLWRMEEREGAYARVERAIELDPTFQSAWASLSEWTAGTAQRDRPIALAERLTKERPGDVRSWLTLARVLPNLDQMDKRLAAIERAIELEPRNVEAHVLRSQALAWLGRFDEALAVCNPTCWNGTVPVELRAEAARVEATRGDLATAVTRMREIVDDEPNHYASWIQLADLYQRLGDSKAHYIAAERVAALAPLYPPSLVYLAEAVIEYRQDREQVKDLLRRAFSLAPDYTYAGLSLFDLYFEDGELDAARDVLKTLQIHVRSDVVLVPRVRLAAAGRNIQDAIEAMRALCTWPDASDETFGTVLTVAESMGWQSEMESILETALSGPDRTPQVAYWWVRVAANRSFPRMMRRFRKLSKASDIAPRALLAAIEAVADNPRMSKAGVFLREWRSMARKRNDTWAMWGDAYYAMGRYRQARRWAADWRKHRDLEPWMLSVVVRIYYLAGLDEEWMAAARAGLEQPPDQASFLLEMWLATVDAGQAETLVSRLNTEVLDPYGRFLYDMLQVLVEVERKPAGAGMSDWYLKCRRMLLQARARAHLIARRPELKRLFRRCVERVATARGGITGQLWRLASWMHI